MSDNMEDTILVSELWSRYLECPICVEEYNDDSNVPIQLPCQHTYCSECLRKLPQHAGGITCPQCKQEHTYESDVTNYPRDLTRGDLLDFIRMKTVSKCEKCGKKKVDYKCSTCSQALCNICKVKTHDKRSFQHHILKPIIRKGKHTDSRCNKDGHDNGFLKFFCMGCMQILCAHDVLEEHRNEELHQVVTTDKAYRNYRSRVDDIVTRMQLEIAFVKLQNKCIMDRLRNNTRDEDELLRSFNGLYTSGKIPDEREEECKTFCYQVCKGRVGSLRIKMQTSEKYLEQLKKCKTNISKTIDRSKDTLTFLSKCRSEMKRIETDEQNFQIALKHITEIMKKEVDIYVPAVIRDVPAVPAVIRDVPAVIRGRRQLQQAMDDMVPQLPAPHFTLWILFPINIRIARRRLARQQWILFPIDIRMVHRREANPQELLACLFIFSCIVFIFWIMPQSYI